MGHGGIFSGPTALGIPETGVFRNAAGGFRGVGLGGVSQDCIFATSWPIGGGEATRAIQAEMARRGATKLKVDGFWGNCSESAYQKIFGEPLSKASIEKNFNISCKSYNKAGTFVPSKCSGGTDAVTAPTTPEVVPAPPGPGQTTPPVVCNEGYIKDAITGGCKVIPGVNPPKPKPPTTTFRPPAKAQTWISGIPNIAVIGVGSGLALVVVGAIVMTRK